MSRIDPAVETREYTEAVLAKAAPALDAQGMALLEEDLRSPCTEEIAVFSAFARTVAEGENGFVVLDTAPTGHTMLLLDAAEAYHRDVTRTLSDLPDAVRELLPRLRDPEFTRVLLVTLPEATPVHEAARLQDDLSAGRHHTVSPGWSIRASAADGFRDPVLVERGERELPFIAEVREPLFAREWRSFRGVPSSRSAPRGCANWRRVPDRSPFSNQCKRLSAHGTSVCRHNQAIAETTELLRTLPEPLGRALHGGRRACSARRCPTSSTGFAGWSSAPAARSTFRSPC